MLKQRNEENGLTANPFYLGVGLYLILDALAVGLNALQIGGLMPAVSGIDWVRVHLLTIGVLVQMILGSLPGLTAANRGASRPSPRLNWMLWLLTNASLVILLLSMPAGLIGIAAAGAVGIFAAVLLMLHPAFQQPMSSQKGLDAVVRLYVAGPIFFLIGILMALSMLLNWWAPGGMSGILEAHVHGNAWGFLGLVVAGFLMSYIPTWVKHSLRFPAILSPMSWLLLCGATALVAGPWLNILALTILGLGLYMAGTVLLLANLVGTIAAAHGWTPNLAHLSLAYLWMIVPAIVAPLVLVTTHQLPTGGIEAAAVSGLVAGWILQVALGALPLYLTAENHNRGVREGSWFSVVMLNAGVALIWLAAFWPDSNSSSLLAAIGYALILIGWLPPLYKLLPQLFTGRQPGDQAA